MSPALRHLGKDLIVTTLFVTGLASYALADETTLKPDQFANASALYATHCTACHNGDRLGGMGPALLPESLERLRGNSIADVIAHGRPATQMPAFDQTLNTADIAVLADWLRQPLAEMPGWSMADIQQSHEVFVEPATLPDKPQFDGDPLNLFTVVEAGDHHVTILNGDTFEPLDRFPTRFALHGGAKYSPDGRFVYLASRDGWVQMYDLYSLQTVAEIRVGLNTRNVAVSDDGRYVMAGNMLPHNLVLLDARDLTPIRNIPVISKDGKSSRVSAVYTAPPRHSFIIALKDLPEVWEISYADDPRPVYPGFVHNYEANMVEALDVQYGPFPIRRIHLADELDDFFFDQEYRHLIGASRNGRDGQVVNLNVGRKIADIALEGMPHLGSGITFEYQGHQVLATPHLKDPKISVIDMETWKTIKTIDTQGPGFFTRSHDNTPYAWVDVFFGPHKDVVHIFDKRTLEIVKTLRPEPGKVAAHVEFDRSGKHALLSIWDDDGAVIVYDAATFEEIKRIPMRKPVGKYNVFNKITYSAGTSH
ncbi:cytochrome D1 domain-containing protein [Thalassospira alkalitolerans]|uniref:cytochrome D1 domain-containing protein n=1 Tax=Thalassospira alkalitolerans TaxID=1293890 RepID=UPI0030EBC234|tara:strand:- start:65405 stop:67012 length:1608 start_codon:yes stop_codon:yes gene_type:complete